jgi:hypothetical protein
MKAASLKALDLTRITLPGPPESGSFGTKDGWRID